jgi:hypothetical protein
MPVTKFHTNTKQRAKLRFCISWSLSFWIANWKTKDRATCLNLKNKLAEILLLCAQSCSFVEMYESFIEDKQLLYIRFSEISL